MLAGAVGVVGLVGLAPPSAQAAATPSVAVPAYFWSSTQWDRMLVSAEELRYVVMNPDSGPGAASYPNFVAQVAAARSQGATVIGYVDTSYGARPLATVKADIDRYRSWYGVNAFFFDQTPYDCAEIAYYEDVENYVRAQAGGFIFHNPGMNPQECYLDVADVVVNFEGSEATYDGWAPAPYIAGYPADRFWHIVYSVDPAHANALLSSAASRNGGLVFLTEQGMPNPFSVVPTDTLWSAQTPTRSGRRAAPQAIPPSTTAPAPNTTRIAAPQSESPTSTAPEGTARAVPVTTRPAAGAAGGPTPTTIAVGSAQSAPVSAEGSMPTNVAPSTVTPTTVVPSTVAPPSPPASLAVLAILPIPADALPIVTPAPTAPPVVEPSTVTRMAAAPGPVPGPQFTSVVTSPAESPTTTRPPAGPALVPVPTRPPAGPAFVPATTRPLRKITGRTGTVRVPAARATTARQLAEVPKQAPVARRRAAR